MAFFWWVWFKADSKTARPVFSGKPDKDRKPKKADRTEKNSNPSNLSASLASKSAIVEKFLNIRSKLIAVILSSILAMILARLFAAILTFRPRPIFHPSASSIAWPYFVNPKALAGFNEWSSFPSDHAALFFTLAFGIFMVSPLLGTIACLYSFMVIFWPRIYAGLHYPTDILAGMAIAVLCVYIFQYQPIQRRLTKPFLKWSQQHPQSFYPCGFLFSFLVATLFDNIRSMGLLIWNVLNMP